MAKNRTVVKVGGREYTMLSDEAPEYIHRVAAYVDRKMEEINVASKLSNVMLAVLAALNITDELLKAQDDNARMRKDLGEARQQLNLLQRENSSIKDRLRGAIDEMEKRK
ncbi:MAG: cell division protein ZapA [Christensenellales bacterium]